MFIKNILILIVLGYLLMGCSTQLPREPQYAEARVAKNYRCDKRIDHPNRPKCLKWVSQSVDDEQTATELADLLIALFNTGRMRVKFQDERPFTVQEAREAFREEIVNIRGWDTRLDSLLCDINKYTACKRKNVRQKHRVDEDTLADITGHSSGFPFASEDEINWNKRRGSTAWRVRSIYLPDVEIIRYPNWVNVRNTEGLPLAEFLEKNPSYCDGHTLTVEIALSDETPPPNYTSEQCYDRYVNDNRLTKGAFDPSDWPEAVLIYPTLGLIFLDHYSDKVIDDTHSRKARKFARSKFSGFEDALREIIKGKPELNTSRVNELLSRLSLYSKSAIFEANNEARIGFEAMTTINNLSVNESHAVKRQSDLCYKNLSDISMLDREHYFKISQKPFFSGY